jgi:ssRNA-specific RNase YbeY (16S rRNA maturation enzyme)
MIDVAVYNTAKYPVSALALKNAAKKVFLGHGIKSKAEASIALVNKTKMAAYAVNHLGEDKKEAAEHPVLSFPVAEIKGRFTFPPDKTIHLGEIIINYPKAVEDARKTNQLIEKIVCDLAAHGALHLISIHHD